MTTYNEARAARIQAVKSVPPELWELRADLMDEAKEMSEAIESKAIRYVKTPAGSRKYGEPIGAPIRPDAPRINYVRNGPKRRSVGNGSSSGSSSFSSVNVSPEATKKVTDLTPGERGREKARLQNHLDKRGVSDSTHERTRLRDIEDYENELDKTVRNPKRNISQVTNDKNKRGESPTTPKGKLRNENESSLRERARDLYDPRKTGLSQNNNREVADIGAELDRRRYERERQQTIADDKRETDRQNAQSNRNAARNKAQRDNSQPAENLSDGNLKDEIRNLSNQGGDITDAGTRRLDKLLAERDKRKKDRDSLAELEKVKKKTPQMLRRIQELRLSVSRVNGSNDNDLARRLVGKAALFEDIRMELDFKVFHEVGVGDWDCSEMSEDELDYFIEKSMFGRPASEKIQQLNAMINERSLRSNFEEFTQERELSWEFSND